MRFPVFARGANPQIDPPILRKSRPYLELQVSERLADWIDYSDHSKGIVCRELLNFGPRREIATPPDTSDKMPPAEVGGCRFLRPIYARKLVLGMEEVRNGEAEARA